MPNKGQNRPQSSREVNEALSNKLGRSPQPLDEEEAAAQSLEMLTNLGRTIEIEVIPRLMQALQSQKLEQKHSNHTGARFVAEVDDFVMLLLNHDTQVAVKYLTTIRASGTPLAAIYLDLLAPAARRVGEMWEEDECSFADVTIVVCRMHQVLLEFSRCFDAPTESSDKNRNVLLLPAPGEQHTFGLLMVIEFLRRDAWNCFSGTPISDADAKKIINAQNYRVIGLSVSADRHIDATANLIKWIRRHSRNSDASVIIGGRAVSENPGLVDVVGADTSADDGEQAARRIDRITRRKIGKQA